MTKSDDKTTIPPLEEIDAAFILRRVRDDAAHTGARATIRITLSCEINDRNGRGDVTRIVDLTPDEVLDVLRRREQAA